MTNGTRPDLLEVWAEVLAREGRFAEAAQHLDEALRLPGPSRNATFAARLRAAREDYLRRAGE
jgi:hypothetical protein